MGLGLEQQPRYARSVLVGLGALALLRGVPASPDIGDPVAVIAELRALVGELDALEADLDGTTGT